MQHFSQYCGAEKHEIMLMNYTIYSWYGKILNFWKSYGTLDINFLKQMGQ